MRYDQQAMRRFACWLAFDSFRPKREGSGSPSLHGIDLITIFGSSQNGHFFIGQVEVAEGDWVRPGETRDLVILNVVGLVSY
jgi:hypothetical protein